ncbi:histidine kinase [Streptomyces sp. NPDC127584]|uniref:histidine kinase n=1 Tax=Streptomyces sp. NPDC127584 TaxID=3345403 RepID=UPI00363862D9
MENTDRLRRLERDLHDGTQGRLVALAITLSLADDALEPAAPDHERLRTPVGRARGQTDETIIELRRLTQGLHPVALEHGLAGPCRASPPSAPSLSPCGWTCHHVPTPWSNRPSTSAPPSCWPTSPSTAAPARPSSRRRPRLADACA